MLLTCPTCRSGLQVPDGTTAHVRCPTCRTVFPAAAGFAPPPAPAAPAPALPPLPTPPAPKPAPPRPVAVDVTARPDRKPPPRRPAEDEDEDRPRKRRRWSDDDYEDDEDRRRRKRRDEADEGDADRPARRRKKRRYDQRDDGLSPEERQRLIGEFQRGMWGCRVIYISLLFYIPAVLMVPLHIIITELTKEPAPAVLVIAGVLSLVNWVVGAVGVVLCLTGPVAPGHWRFGISAAVATVVHAVFLLALVVKTTGQADFRGLERGVAQWAQVATQYESLSFYLAYVVYPDDIPIHRSDSILSFLTGVVEMTRLVLILMLLSCLAAAARDRELSDRCTRMAGRVSVIPGLLALGMLVYKAFVVETGAEQQGAVLVFLLRYIYRGINAVVAGILLLTLGTVRDVADACEFPYQTEVDDLGSG